MTAVVKQARTSCFLTWVSADVFKRLTAMPVRRFLWNSIVLTVAVGFLLVDCFAFLFVFCCNSVFLNVVLGW